MDKYNNRYKTLAAHQAAVRARKLLEGGKNVGPVANADAYGSKIKKSPTKAVRSASTGTNSSKTTTTKKPKVVKKSKLKTSPAATAKKGDGSVIATKVKRSGSTSVEPAKRPNQTKNGASLGSKLSAAEKAKRLKAAMTPNKPARGTARGGSRASNNNRGRTQTSKGPKAGDTRRTRKGSKYVTQMYDGKKWVTGKIGGKG